MGEQEKHLERGRERDKEYGGLHGLGSEAESQEGTDKRRL